MKNMRHCIEKLVESNEVSGEIIGMSEYMNRRYSSRVYLPHLDIDQKQENKDVDKYQKTKDPILLNKIYMARLPSLQYWARTYNYLTDKDSDDMFGECVICFQKALTTYNVKRSSFNNCLYIYLLNCVRNLHTSRRAKKRLPRGMDPNNMSNFMLSLDYNYDGKDGSEKTLGDSLSNQLADYRSVIDDMRLKDTIKILSNNNPVVMHFMKRLSDGNTVASLIKEYKTKQGTMILDRSQIASLNGRHRNKKAVLEILKNYLDHKAFSLINYHISDINELFYTIEVKKSKETDAILKVIRKMKRDRPHTMSRINS